MLNLLQRKLQRTKLQRNESALEPKNRAVILFMIQGVFRKTYEAHF
jgi:hypothetical protein